MFKLTARNRIAIALVGVVTSVLVAGKLCGVLPDQEQLKLRHRATV